MRFICFLVVAVLAGTTIAADKNVLLNVSYDVAREFYEEYNRLFVEYYKKKSGRAVRVSQSHAGSTKQARAVMDGIPADVLTMNQPADVDSIAERGRNLVAKDWRQKFPHDASPCSSTVAFMVRKGNPKAITDWDDLAVPGTSVVVPNPKTSGNGRYSYLAMWSFAGEKYNNDEAKIRYFVRDIFRNVPVLDTGGRGATTTFVHRAIGDVLLTFEAEILTSIQEAGTDKFEIVYPSLSVEAEMPIAVVERVVDRRGTRELATEYLNFLYSEPAQELMAKHFYRPRLESVASKHLDRFGKYKLVKIDEAFGGWSQAHKTHFAEGGSFDLIYAALRK